MRISDIVNIKSKIFSNSSGSMKTFSGSQLLNYLFYYIELCTHVLYIIYNNYIIICTVFA